MQTSTVTTLLAILGCASLFGLVSARPNPDDELGAQGILDAAGDASKYGDNVGKIDDSFVSSVFGTGPQVKKDDKFGPPKGQVEDDQYDNCTYYAKDGYKCVPYYQCKNGYIITDGGGLFDIRSGLLDNVKLDPESSKCPSYLEVCCRSEDFQGLPPPTKPPAVTTTPEPVTARPHTPKGYAPKCGQHNVGGVGLRIINNNINGSTQFGEWPHMCAILNRAKVGKEEVNLYVCGASLISPGIILTAAHCVNKLTADTLKVRCGEWDTQQTIEPISHEDRGAKRISIHPEFNPFNLQNDFALIHLDKPFILSAHIDTVCLPNPFTAQNSYLNKKCVATGWGKDEFGSKGKYQVIMKQVVMDTVNHQECQDRLRTSRVGTSFVLDGSFMCAGGVPGQDTCKGDGGGPLVCPTIPGAPENAQRYVQAGIVAWGIGCGETYPGVYADVSKSLCFIDWATRCVEGENVDLYGFSSCRRWAKRQYCGYKAQVASLEAEATSAQDTIARSKIARESNKLKSLMEAYTKSINSCQSGPKDIDCSVLDYSEQLDLSGDARQGEEKPLLSPKILGEEETPAEDATAAPAEEVAEEQPAEAVVPEESKR